MKRFSFLLALALSAAALTARAAATNQNGSPAQGMTNSAADRDWQEFETFVRAQKMPEGFDKLSPSQQLMAKETVMREASAKAIWFYEKHPADPRRWKAVETVKRAMPQFIKEIKPGYDANQVNALLVKDEAAKAARKKLLAEMEAAREVATDVPDDIRERLAGAKLAKEISEAKKWGASGDWPGLESRMDAFEAEFPNLEKVVGIETSYLDLLKLQKPAAVEPRLAKVLQNPNAHVRTYAASQRLMLARGYTPVEMKFTALDGRVVDLAQLRGKVVLIDFWATWCGPCVAELPNVKAVYEKYHTKGLEVVGISLDNQEDRKKLEDFVAKQNMPWPQFFDGRGWKNELAVKHGIHRIPTTFLLDREGKISTTSARGKTLEPEVARLLGR